MLFDSGIATEMTYLDFIKNLRQKILPKAWMPCNILKFDAVLAEGST